MTPTDDQRQQQQLELSERSLASKKMRMTLACVRCRSKKVKCDTKHPSCTRCFHAKVTCSYEGSSSQVDIYNIIRLNDTVDTLQQRIQYLESTIGDIHHRTSTAGNHLSGHDSSDAPFTMVSPGRDISSISASKSAPSLLSHGQHQYPHQWSLSLTSTGLRIDTNVVSLPNLYSILLSGVSQLDLNQQDTTTTTTTTTDDSLSSLGNSTSSLHYSKMGHRQRQQQQSEQQQLVTDLTDKLIMVQPKTPLWRSKITTFPLYSTWSSDSSSLKEPSHAFSSSAFPTNLFHLHQRRHQHYGTATAAVASSVLDNMIDVYSECFLCLPDTGYGGTISERYHQGTLDPLLANAIFAWSARHGAIYHNLFKGQDPNQVGECYFAVAKDLLKDRFTTPSMDTLHGVLILYIYAIGRPSRGGHSKQDQPQQQTTTTAASEAYIFLGLAIRMCLDLKLHKEKNDDDDDGNNNEKRMKMEHDRRFFWVLYFLETFCALHSDRPFSLPSEDQITVPYPEILGNETGGRRWRTEFMVKRFRITRIYRYIIQRTSQSTPLPLSCISELDASLCEWYDQLASYLQYQQGDLKRRKWKTTSFREQACIKLNFEYHFQRCQLYAVFLKQKQDDKEEGGSGGGNHIHGDDEEYNRDECASATMEAKAKKVCIASATMTVELMQCWNQLQQRWCHFSLESLMMAVNIFEILLKDEDRVEQAKAHLTTILDILQASPIQHHRHVIIVTTRIQELLRIKCSDSDASDIGWIPGTEMETTIIFSGENNEQQQLQQHPTHQQLGTTNFQQSMDIYNTYLPTQQYHHGMIGVHYGDLPFSDILYNPVMQSPSLSYGSTQQQWSTAQQSPSEPSQLLPLDQTYSSTPSTSSSSYPAPPLPSDDYSTGSAATSLWTTTLHQPTYASNGSAIFGPISLHQGHHHHISNQQPGPTNGHSRSYSADQ